MTDSLANTIGGTALTGVCCLAYLVPIVLGILGFVLWIVALVDVAQRTDAEFPNARQGHYDSSERVVWLLIVVLTGVLGAVIYYFVVMRPYPRVHRHV